MQINVRLFAGLAETAGARSILVELPEDATADAARRAVVALFPAMQGMCERVALAVNAEYSPAERTLREGDEVALIPPVSGG